MPLKWKKVWIADDTYESAGVFDVNNDGVLDIVCGAFWYQGPDFRKKHLQAAIDDYHRRVRKFGKVVEPDEAS